MKILNQKELAHVNGGMIPDLSNIIICNRYTQYTVAKKPQTYLS